MKTISAQSEKNVVDEVVSLAYGLWILITVLFGFSIGTLYLFKGYAFLRSLIQTGPLSIIELTLTSVGMVWLGFGVSLVLLRRSKLRTQYGLTIIFSFLILLLYVNILRERINYGDVRDYIQAAHNLADGVPFHKGYLYPPFFANILTPLLPFGDRAIEWLLWIANIFSLCLFFVLLTFTLNQYGYNNKLSNWLGFFFIVINVPVLRTLGYVQVNLHVINLILISLLSNKRIPILSALTMALAVHLKISPIIIVLLFILRRDWRWVAWFAAIFIILVGVTALPYGWSPFFDFMNNIRNIYATSGINFRETSVDSIFRSLAVIGEIPLSRVTWIIIMTKLCVLAAVLGVMIRVIKNGSFLKGKSVDGIVYNSLPFFLILMLVESPLIWEHHPVFVALPYLLVLKRLNTSSEMVIYGYAYLLEYLLPTFDFFPWSFGRLLSPLLLLGIIHSTSKRFEDGYFWNALSRFGQ